MNKLTLKKLYNTNFFNLYKKLLQNNDISESELEKILGIGIFLVGKKDVHLQNLGYRIFLLYSKFTNDYKPLYELCINKGFIPISEFIQHKLNYSEKFGNLYTKINTYIAENFKYGDLYQTIGQYNLFNDVSKFVLKSQIIVAPTSYGKTELILSFMEEKYDFKKICIIVPTKSLLAQIKKRIIDKFGYKKIITYPEMYNEKDVEIIAVLTQERLLRLLQSKPKLKFDLLIVDEAHNILNGFSNENTRSVILMSVIIICQRRNKNIICKYLTPFLQKKDSFENKYIPNNNIKWNNVNEIVKSEIFYFYDLEKDTKVLFDQYSTNIDNFIDVKDTKSGDKKFEDDIDIILSNRSNKNIIYINNPKNIEKFALEISHKLSKLDINKLAKAANDLREYVHEKYNLADCIEKGVIYHHGSVPEQIRYFIENLYKDIPEIEILIANSTLLEGVNIPATRMFILDPYRGHSYLSSSAFKNLIGRVCRFNEIFNIDTGNLEYLLPEIHIIKGNYCNKSFSAKSFIDKTKLLITREKKIKDDIQNPLLKNSNCGDKIKIQKAEDILENISHNDIITKDNSVNKPCTEIGRLCFENNVNIFNIFEKEIQINEELKKIAKVENIDEIFVLMNHLFFSKIDNDKNRYSNLIRLKEEQTQKFYKMLIDWKMSGLTFKTMISKVLTYWNKFSKYDESKFIYVGKWGDVGKNSHKKYWTNISIKTEFEKVNLAIVRLKEEFDFIDNEIIKYIEILNSLGLINESLYLKIKYGTDDKIRIALLNCGISITLSNLLQEKYSNLFNIDLEQGTLIFTKELISEMEKNKENDILICEVRMNSKE